MINSDKNYNNIEGKSKFFSFRQYLFLAISLFFVFILFFGGAKMFGFVQENFSEEMVCGDGTPQNTCSEIKPYFCENGKLIDLASVCGCPGGFFEKGNYCVSSYQQNPRKTSLFYTLRGKNFFIDFVTYGRFEDYLSEISPSISFFPGDNFSRIDFKMKILNDEEQRKMILPLVIKIQNLTSIKEDQMRIAISIVQNIPFGISNQTYSFGGYEMNFSRYPYQVLYENKGICGEKTDLLALILKEMGYGVGFFYYPTENHEALGIECSKEESLSESGYCFLETTGPSIITDSEISYVNIGKLSSSPEIYKISGGNLIKENIYEYSDADKLISIRDFSEKYGFLLPWDKWNFDSLKKKYGLIEDYYSG